jgi:chromosome segregation ATPase
MSDLQTFAAEALVRLTVWSNENADLSPLRRDILIVGKQLAEQEAEIQRLRHNQYQSKEHCSSCHSDDEMEAEDCCCGLLDRAEQAEAEIQRLRHEDLLNRQDIHEAVERAEKAEKAEERIEELEAVIPDIKAICDFYRARVEELESLLGTLQQG